MRSPDQSQKMVIVGMSGGVDSAVSAALLKEQGYNVQAIFMKNWEELDENGNCTAMKDFEDVARVCDRLDIPYHSIEFVDEYRENVFKYFLDDYKNGYTPNPDILCNREIKFKVFFEKAMELGADYLATGHYCQNKLIDGERRLVKGLDQNKDQTYFLYTMKEEILQKVLFPIGDLNKSEVREIAKKYDLAVKNKKDSTGICFIGERNFKNFLSQYIESQKGNFIDLDGQVVGKHDGACYYTIGQRKGLGLGGQGAPWFVVDKNMNDNSVTVVRGEEHPALFCDELWASELSFVSPHFKIEKFPYKLTAKIRYRQTEQKCQINSFKNGQLHVSFDALQRAVAIGQSIVLYDGEICIGGGRIVNKSESYYQLNKNLPDKLGT